MNGTCSNPTYVNQGDCLANAGSWTDSGNGLPVIGAVYHSTITFPSHPHGNMFLNSPHGKWAFKYDEGAGKYGVRPLRGWYSVARMRPDLWMNPPPEVAGESY